MSPFRMCSMFIVNFSTKKLPDAFQNAVLEAAILKKLSGNHCIAHFLDNTIQRQYSCFFHVCALEPRASKDFVGLYTLKIATLDAVLSVNGSSIARGNILKSFGWNPWRNSMNWLKEVEPRS